MIAPLLAAALCASVGTAGGRPGAPWSPGDSALVRAESLLVSGRLVEARRVAERLRNLRPRDPQVLVLLGRIHLAWPVVGRYQAETLFSRAAALDPANPEPLYYLGLVGLALGGDDGEEVARRGLVAVLALDPGYRDSWALWGRLYRGDRERRAALAALDRHAGRRWEADYWRAQLLLELRRYDESGALLEDVARRRPADPGPRAWLARLYFLAGRDEDGMAAYAAALERAGDDTGQVLWAQVRGAATPGERRSWASTPADGRAAFFRLFWARREPDLSTLVNERLATHFRRLEEAGRTFALKHPNSRYFRSPVFRALAGGVGRYPGGLEGAEERALSTQCSARLPGVLDTVAQAGLAARAEDPGRPPENLDDGLDDRGRIFLRHGRPDYVRIGSLADETWCYYRADGHVLRVTFVRRTGGYGATGDMVVTPLVAGESESAAELLTTDSDGARNTLAFTFWPAAFRAADARRTELFVLADSVRGIAALVAGDGREAARDSASGRPLRLLAEPGRYVLLVDAVRGADTSRYRGTVALPDFAEDVPVVSSILLASGSVAPDREAMSAAAPGALVLAATRPLRVFAELYHLGRVDGVVRYRAEYRFARTDGFVLRRERQRETTIAFDRVQPFTPRLVESLVVDPDRLPPGRYRLHLEIVDLVRGVRATSATIEFRLR